MCYTNHFLEIYFYWKLITTIQVAPRESIWKPDELISFDDIMNDNFDDISEFIDDSEQTGSTFATLKEKLFEYFIDFKEKMKDELPKKPAWNNFLQKMLI